MLVFCLLLGVAVLEEGLGYPSEAPTELLEHMTEQDLKRFFGIKRGEKAPSHDIDKMSLPESHPSSGEIRTSLTAFGKLMKLKLKAPEFKVPDFLLETHAGGKTRSAEKVKMEPFYGGEVEGDPSSHVVLTRTPEGMRGMIKGEHGTYMVHPIPAHIDRQLRSAHPNPPYIDRQLRSVHPNPPYIDRQLQSDTSEKLHLIVDRSQEPNHEIGCEVRDSEIPLVKDYRRETGDERSVVKSMETRFVLDHFYYHHHYDESDPDKIKELIADLAKSVVIMFLRESIGPIRINFMLTRVTMMKTPEFDDYVVNAGSGQKLGKFEAWIKDHNPASDDDPDHTDVSVLLTRDTAGGYASANTACRRPVSCALAGDIGLQTAPIIVHEIGHLIGISHDGSNCEKGHIMSAVLSAGKGALQWTHCSEEQMQNFLRADSSKCFDDEPAVESHELYVNNLGELPGVKENADRQCQLQFGEEARVCPIKKSDCGSLMCLVGQSCTTKMSPMADGTKCGPREWCIHGVCQDNGSPITHGSWSAWSADFSTCSKTCGIGVRYKSRTCTNPAPVNGGKYCIGSPKKYKACNMESCPDGISDRVAQCTNKDPTYNPYFLSYYPCGLACYDSDMSLIKYGAVDDGSRCTSDVLDRRICIQGECKPVLCDGSIGTGTAIVDRCGICNGDGLECQVMASKEYLKSDFKETDLKFHGNRFKVYEVLSLPVGSVEIKIEKQQESYHALCAYDGKNLYPASLMASQDFVLENGDVIKFERIGKRYPPSAERLTINGPTKKTITIMVAKIGGGWSNVKITVSGKVPREKADSTAKREDEVQWKMEDWSQCSANCGTGTRSRQVYCYKPELDTKVREELCQGMDKPAGTEECKLKDCSPEWYISEWSKPCTKTCGKGMQTRQAYCRQLIDATNKEHKRLDDTECPDRKEVPTVMSCNDIVCPSEWAYSEWSKCSKGCGKGVRTKKRQCQTTDDVGKLIPLDDRYCKTDNANSVITEKCKFNMCLVSTSTANFMFCDKEDTKFNRMTKDFTGQKLPYLEIVDKCAAEAASSNQELFGVKDEKCWSGSDIADGKYANSGESRRDNRKKCKAGDGLFLYTSKKLPEYEFMGCYQGLQQEGERVANFRDIIEWMNMNATIQQCAYVARDHGANMFGLHFYGECLKFGDLDLEKKPKDNAACYEKTGDVTTVGVFKFKASTE